MDDGTVAVGDGNELKLLPLDVRSVGVYGVDDGGGGRGSRKEEARLKMIGAVDLGKPIFLSVLRRKPPPEPWFNRCCSGLVLKLRYAIPPFHFPTEPSTTTPFTIAWSLPPPFFEKKKNTRL